MLKDITIGQYFPGDTVIHRLDPRIKILIIIMFITSLFFIRYILSIYTYFSLYTFIQLGYQKYLLNMY